MLMKVSVVLSNILCMTKHKYYMQLALLEAEKAFSLGEIPIGAVLVCDGQIFTAHNLRENNTDATAHAELLIIRKACESLKKWRLKNSTLYVTVEPCPMCAGAIVLSRIENLVYGCPDAKAGGCESVFNIVQNRYLNHQVNLLTGVLETDCQNIIKKFFSLKRELNHFLHKNTTKK